MPRGVSLSPKLILPASLKKRSHLRHKLLRETGGGHPGQKTNLASSKRVTVRVEPFSRADRLGDTPTITRPIKRHHGSPGRRANHRKSSARLQERSRANFCATFLLFTSFATFPDAKTRWLPGVLAAAPLSGKLTRTVVKPLINAA